MGHTREDVINYIDAKYDILPEYTFKKFPDYCIFRHKKAGKWFGIIMNIPKEKVYGKGAERIDIINLKINPELNTLFKGKHGYFSAYHMNKEHWISIDLTEINSMTEITNLIDDSFNLTKK